MLMRPALAAITLTLLCSGFSQPAQSGERKLFENVRGWEVERNIGQTGRYTCQMSYSYHDKDDNNAENAIVLSLDEGKVNLVLGYENWTWDKNEAVQASFSIDKQVVYPKQGWTGDAKLLWSPLPEAVIPKLLKGKQIVLKFDDGAADFSIPGFADAFDSLKRCNAAAPATSPQAAAPAEPNQTHLQAYFMGLILQKTAATCAVSTTAPQRAAIDTKVAALRTEFAAIEPVIQEEIKKQGGTPDCPKTPADAATFETELKSYVDLSPEDYVAAADKRSAAREAAKKAEAEARAAAEAEAKMRSEIETKMRAEAETKNKADAEAKARADMEARIRAEVEAKLKAEAEANAAPKP